MASTELMALAVVLLAGFMRGMTGFGGTMVMAAPLSLLLGPVAAVVIGLTLEASAALVMFPRALPHARPRVLAFLTVPAALTVPVGTALLLALDPLLARKVIAAVVVAFSLLLLSGARYAGSPRPAVSVALGSVVGVLLGATSVGALPVVLYLLSSSDPQRVTRADLTVYITILAVIGLIVLGVNGAVTGGLLRHALLLSGPFLLSTWVGGLAFERASEAGARRLALALMLASGTVGLLV